MRVSATVAALLGGHGLAGLIRPDDREHLVIEVDLACGEAPETTDLCLDESHSFHFPGTDTA